MKYLVWWKDSDEFEEISDAAFHAAASFYEVGTVKSEYEVYYMGWDGPGTSVALCLVYRNRQG